MAEGNILFRLAKRESNTLNIYRKCQYLKDFVFMLGFTLLLDLYISFILLYLEGLREGTKLPHVIKKPAYPAFSISSYLY